MAEPKLYILSGISTLVGGIVFFLGFLKMRKFRIIKDTPRSKIRSLAIGIVEIHGTVLPDTLIKSPFSKSDCVYYKYVIKEYRRRHTVSRGKAHTTTRWETIASGDRSVPFFAKDETGQVWVDPDGADFKVSLKRAFYQKGKWLSGSIGALGDIIKAVKNWDGSDPVSLDVDAMQLEPIGLRSSGFRFSKVGDRKYYEYYLEPEGILFVLGTAANSPAALNNLMIRKGQNEKTFIIADSSEKDVIRTIRKNMILCFVFGGVFFIAGIVMALHLGGAY